jgi:large subunit ribosomal protein L31e
LSEKVVHVIPLRDAWKGSRLRRAKTAIRIVREYVSRHTGARKVVISGRLAEAIWARGIQNPPRKVRVELVREDEDTVTVRLEGEGGEEEE